MESKVFNVTIESCNETHLLIAGTTGSGKSVLLNNIILNLFCDKNPQFIFIDIKKVELIEYKNTFNCIGYADDAEKAIALLNKAVNTIESRFKQMQKKYQKIYEGKDLYIVIDELADLLTDPKIKKDVLASLCRIGQIGRAAKVHILACTQIPNRSILSSQLRVNFTGIIGLRTAGERESINIIGCKGLESFPQYGEAIYLKNGYMHRFKFNLPDEAFKEAVISKFKKRSLAGILFKAAKDKLTE